MENPNTPFFFPLNFVYYPQDNLQATLLPQNTQDNQCENEYDEVLKSLQTKVEQLQEEV